MKKNQIKNIGLITLTGTVVIMLAYVTGSNNQRKDDEVTYAMRYAPAIRFYKSWHDAVKIQLEQEKQAALAAYNAVKRHSNTAEAIKNATGLTGQFISPIAEKKYLDYCQQARLDSINIIRIDNSLNSL